MKEKLFKIAMLFLESAEKDNDFKMIFIALEAIKAGHIRSNQEFITFLSEVGLDPKKIHTALEEIIKTKDSKQILEVVKYLGETSNKGFTLLKLDTLSKLFDQLKLKEKIPQEKWYLFKDKRWLKHHKTALSSDEKKIFTAINNVISGEIKNKNGFLAYLESVHITTSEMFKAVLNIFKRGKVKEIVPIAYNLGTDKGVGIIEKTWLSRNFDTLYLRKVIPENYWYLFKDNAWIQENKTVKD